MDFRLPNTAAQHGFCRFLSSAASPGAREPAQVEPLHRPFRSEKLVPWLVRWRTQVTARTCGGSNATRVSRAAQMPA